MQLLLKMERRNGGARALAAAAVWLLCSVVVVAGVSAEHSTQQWQSEPADPGRRGSSPAPAPSSPAPAPAPTAGADDLPAPVYSPAPVTTTPHFGFPLQPTVGVTAAPPVAGAPGGGGEGYPFIGSNPTVPLPTGVTDTASVLPLPDTTQTHDKVVGRASLLRAAPAAMIGLLLAFSVLLFN